MTDCGIPKGYQQHLKRGEQPCQACTKANREYIYAWRRNNRDTYLDHQARTLARNRAMRQLARLHQEELRALYDHELSKTDARP